MPKAKFLISKSKVIEHYNKIKDICDIVSYSSKTNPVVTEILEENSDSMFSIHMINELKNVNDISRVIFLVQGCDAEFIKNLINKGIKWFVVDNEKDLDEFVKFDGKNINLLLRIKLKENTLKTEKYFVFGMNSDLVNKKLKELKGKFGSLGVHFHRKTQNIAEWSLKSDFEDIIDEYNFENIDYLCIGGGLPSYYANTNVDVIENVLIKIKEFWNYLNNKGIKMIVEPGRFIAAPSGRLVTNVVRVYDKNIIVDASVYNSDMDALIVPVKLLIEGEGIGDPYVIKGVTPCSMDLFRYKVYLKNVKEGDKIVFLNAGAYNFGSDFCDLDKLDVEIVD